MQIAFSVHPGREVVVIVIIVSQSCQTSNVALRDNPCVQLVVSGRFQALCSQVPEGRAYLLVTEDVCQEARMSHVYFQLRLV